MTKLLAQAFARAAKLPAGEQDAIAGLVLAELDLRAQYVEAARDPARESEADAWVGGIENSKRRAGWEAWFRRAGAGRVRDNLRGSLSPDEPLDR